jgi:hypothetical protein
MFVAENVCGKINRMNRRKICLKSAGRHPDFCGAEAEGQKINPNPEKERYNE